MDGEFVLPNLVHLDVSDNKGLKGGIPDSLSHSKKMHTLHSAGSLLQITSKVVGKLTSLKIMHCGGNQFNGLLDDLKNLINLEIISFAGSHDGLLGELPASFANLKALKHVDLSKTLVRGDFPAAIGEMPNLETWIMHNTEVTGVVPPGLLAHPKLKVLDLNRNYLRGALTVSEVGDKTFPLETLRMSFNHFHTTTETLTSLANRFPKAKIFDLSNSIEVICFLECLNHRHYETV